MPETSLTARIAFTNFDGAKVLDALTAGEPLTEDLVRKLAPQTFAGYDAIVQWLHNLSRYSS